MDDQRTNRESGRVKGPVIIVAIGSVFASFGLLLLGMTLCGTAAAVLRGKAISRDMAFALLNIIGLVSCWLLFVMAFVKSESNLQPGEKWWSGPMSNDREVLARHYTPKGLFWRKVGICSVIAGFAVPAIVFIARWLSR
jgi:hypothetical protein